MPKIHTRAITTAIRPGEPEPTGPELTPEDATAINDALEAAFAAGVTATQIVEAIAALHVAPEDELPPLEGEEMLPEAMQLSLRSERVSLARARRDVESGERRRLIAQLVTDAGRAPATVWASASATRAKPYLERMTLSELRAHVAVEIASVPPAARRRAPRPPASGTGPELSESEARICAELACDPKDFVAMRERFASATTGAQQR